MQSKVHVGLSAGGEDTQSVQKANELAVQALARAGYDSQWLQATFNAEEDEVVESRSLSRTLLNASRHLQMPNRTVVGFR